MSLWTNYFDTDVSLCPTPSLSGSRSSSEQNCNSSNTKRNTKSSGNSKADFATIAGGVTLGVLAGSTIWYGLKELFGPGSNDQAEVVEDQARAQADDCQAEPKRKAEAEPEPTPKPKARQDLPTNTPLAVTVAVPVLLPSSSRPGRPTPTPNAATAQVSTSANVQVQAQIPSTSVAAATVTVKPVNRPSENVVLALAASPRRGAAVMVLHDSAEVYHYSLDWTSHLDFSRGELQSKYETTNAYIALELFSPLIETLQEQNPHCKVVLKVGNARFERRQRLLESLGEEAAFWNYVQELRGDICEEWSHVDVGQSGAKDPELSAAEELSKGSGAVADLHPSYTRRVNCDGAASRALKQNLEVLPSNYLAILPEFI